jgi:hypothetical protein
MFNAPMNAPMKFLRTIYFGFGLLLIPAVTVRAEHRPMGIDQPGIDWTGNNLWSVHGMLETTAGITISTDPQDRPTIINPWSAFAEWASLKFAWTAHTSLWSNSPPANANRAYFMNMLGSVYPISYVNTTALGLPAPTTARGYLWQDDQATGEKWWGLFYHYDNQPKYICAAYNYYQWTKDAAWLQAIMPKLEAVMDYIATTMQGANDVPTCPGANTGLSGSGAPSEYADAIRIGGKAANIGSAYYTALRNMIELETVLNNTSRASAYLAMAAAYPAKYDAALWNTNTSRYAGWRDTGGNLHDYGFTYMNLEALARGLGNDAKAFQIFDWLDNGSAQAAWSSVYVGSTNIYNFVSVPRLNTLRVADVDWHPWSILPAWRVRDYSQTNADGSFDTFHDARYVNNQNDGGGWLWASYYDCMARLKWQDADRAYQKYAAMLFRYNGDTNKYTLNSKSRQYSSYGDYFNSFMPFEGECGIAALTPLYGFMGVAANSSGLCVTPNLPTRVSSLQWSDINYKGTNFQVTVSDSQMLANLEANSSYNSDWTLNNASDTIQQNFSASSYFNKFGLKVGLFGLSGPISFDATLLTSADAKLSTQRITVSSLDEGGWVQFTFNSQPGGNYRVKIGNLSGTSLAWYKNAGSTNFGAADRNGAPVVGNYNLRLQYEYQQALITQFSQTICDPCPAGGFLRQGIYPTTKFSQILARVGTWAVTTSGCRLTLQRSVAGGQQWLTVARQTYNQVPDNGWLALNFADQPPGSYALTLDNPVGTIGWYRDSGITTPMLANANANGIPIPGARTVVVYRRQYGVTIAPGGGTTTVNAGDTLVWDGSNGTITAASTVPVFLPPVISGSNLILSGTNGAASGLYYVRSSTNLALPRTNWTVLATNVFDGVGNFSFTNAINPAEQKKFYRLQLP